MEYHRVCEQEVTRFDEHDKGRRERERVIIVSRATVITFVPAKLKKRLVTRNDIPPR